MQTSTIPSSSYVCDTLPAPRLASVASESDLQPERSPSPPSPFVEVSEEMISIKQAELEVVQSTEAKGFETPPARKLCVRHQRMADEGTNLKLQQVSTLSFGMGLKHVYRLSLAP